jgi:hypothetical protein
MPRYHFALAIGCSLHAARGTIFDANAEVSLRYAVDTSGVDVSMDTAGGLRPRFGTRAEYMWRISIGCFCGSVQPAAFASGAAVDGSPREP